MREHTDGLGMEKMDGTARRGRMRRILDRRSARVSVAIALGVAGLSVAGATTSVVSKPATAGAASACTDDGASGCTVTLPCTTGTCPTIDVGPNVNLVDSQYMSIKARNFDPTGSMRVAICSVNTIASSGGDPSCLSGIWSSQEWAPISIPVLADTATQNLTSLSYPAFFDPSGEGNNLMPAQDLSGNVGDEPGFNCDNTADPCAIVVTEEPFQGNAVGKGPLVTASNSAVVPLSFLASSSGCPPSAPVMQTDSTNSLEHFMTAAVIKTCGGPNGVVASNTVTDGQTATSDFGVGAKVVFTDNPQDAVETANLTGKKYAFIPVAVSGTAVSFLASEIGNNLASPLATYNLTPNMVAGMITSLYQYPTGQVGFDNNGQPQIQLADNLIPPLNCAVLVGCPAKNKTNQAYNELAFNSFDLLNQLSGGQTPPTALGSFMSNVPSGASYQVTDWICRAPNTPFPVVVNEKGQSSPVTVSVTDQNLAGTTLTTAPVGSSIWPPYANAPWLFPACHGYTTFPALAAQGTNYSEASSPAFQAKAMRGWAFGGGTIPPPPPQPPLAAFGVMDSSQAAFYGLNAANVQNASGAFVAPTASSLEAAANELTPCPPGYPTCPAGTYNVNYANADASAYPMPDVTYAVVPTDAQPADTAKQITNLLTNLVNFSHSSAVPAGYAPLPDSLYQAAMAAIGTDVVAVPPPPAPQTGSSGSTSTPSPSTNTNGSDNQSFNSSGGSSDFSNSGSGSDTSSNQLPLTAPDGSSGGGSTPGGSGASAPAGGPTVPTGILLVGLDAASRYLLPAILLLAAICLIGGPLLLFAPEVRRRRRASKDPS